MPNFDWRSLLDLAPVAAGALAPDPLVGTAIIQGHLQSMERMREENLRRQQLDRQNQLAQAQIGHMATQNDIAGQHAGIERGRLALENLKAFYDESAKAVNVGQATAEDPLTAQNALATRLSGMASSFGLPATATSGLLPNMAQAVSRGAKADAAALLEGHIKGVPDEQKGQPITDASVSFTWHDQPERLKKALRARGHQDGDPIKPSELRSMYGAALNPQTGDPWQPLAKPATPPQTGSFADYLTATPEDQAKILAGRKAYGQADDRALTVTVPGGTAHDPKDIADAIISGDQPPTLQGLYRLGAPVRAELARRGYPLATAQTDWQATQKHFATLNGAQQTRLRQAVDTAAHSLDVIDDLAAKWNGGRFPLLNKVNLMAAASGAYGNEVASVAQQLKTQITDLTSELGNVYMGGNTPTDQAMKLAAQNLNAEWSAPVLKDMVKLARTNLTIRQNAIKNTNVLGVSAVNPYAPPVTPAETPGPKSVGQRFEIISVK